MPGIVDRMAATEAAAMPADDLAVLFDDDPVGVSLHLDGSADGARRDRVFVGVEADKAGL